MASLDHPALFVSRAVVDGAARRGALSAPCQMSKPKQRVKQRQPVPQERQWCEYDRGGSITCRQLAKLLQLFGVRSETIRVGDKTPKGYKLAAFQDAFERYLPPSSGDPASSATSATLSCIEGLEAPPAATITTTAGATDLQQATS